LLTLMIVLKVVAALDATEKCYVVVTSKVSPTA
jgi:hypothetical protein